MVAHNGDILLESFVFCHPLNVIDYVSSRTFILPRDHLLIFGLGEDVVKDEPLRS